MAVIESNSLLSLLCVQVITDYAVVLTYPYVFLLLIVVFFNLGLKCNIIDIHQSCKNQLALP